MMLKPLNHATKGERIAIRCLACSARECCQLQDLGCVEGAQGQVISNHARIVIQVGETRMAISEKLARSILVSNL